MDGEIARIEAGDTRRSPEIDTAPDYVRKMRAQYEQFIGRVKNIKNSRDGDARYEAVAAFAPLQAELTKAGELDKDLPGVRFVVFDADADTDRLKAAGYGWTYVPLFVRPAVNGRSSGVQIAGVANKGTGVDALIPRLRKLLGRVK